MSASIGKPIDIQAEYNALTELTLAEHDTKVSAFAELGGRSLADERLHFLPFAESVLADPTKQHITRGLGELGLLAVQPAAISVMKDESQHHYAAALLAYRQIIQGRSAVYGVSGTAEADWFQRLHPGADEAWSMKYGTELHELEGAVSLSGLYSAALAIKEADPAMVHKAGKLQQHAGHTGRLILHVKPNGNLVAVRNTRRAA